MWLYVPCSECPSRENLAPFGVHRIQGKRGYPCLTPNAPLRIASIICSDEEMQLFGVRHSE